MSMPAPAQPYIPPDIAVTGPHVAAPPLPAPPPQQSAVTPASPARVISAHGALLVGRDGRQVHVRYGFDALVLIEEHWGSLNAMQEALEAGKDGAVFTAVARSIHAGTTHAFPWGGGPPERPADGPGWRELLEFLVPGKVQEYSGAVGAALTEAFGSLVSQGNDDGQGAPNA